MIVKVRNFPSEELEDSLAGLVAVVTLLTCKYIKPLIIKLINNHTQLNTKNIENNLKVG